MSRVLVTGASTPIGQAVIAGLMDDPAVEHVLAVAAEPTMRGQAGQGSRWLYEPVDLTRVRAVHALLFGLATDLRIDTVIHLAQHRRARDASDRTHELTVEATRTLLLECERHPTIRRFVLRSGAEVYRVRAETPTLIDEDHPLDFSPDAPAWIRDRVEADMVACARIGASRMNLLVLRLAECVAPHSGSQLHDQLQSRLCLHPAGYDPMLNLLSVRDAARALCLAARYDGRGVFNIPGRDTLPLSEALARAGRRGIAAPGALLGPLYALRARVLGSDFRYDANRWRYHFSAVLDGTRAHARLGYLPTHALAWSRNFQDESALDG